MFLGKTAFFYTECGMMCVCAIACALRWGVALVGEFLYWALLTPSWENISGMGGTSGEGTHMRP